MKQIKDPLDELAALVIDVLIDEIEGTNKYKMQMYAFLIAVVATWGLIAIFAPLVALLLLLILLLVISWMWKKIRKSRAYPTLRLIWKIHKRMDAIE